jgi:2'-5' RNA ligase
MPRLKGFSLWLMPSGEVYKRLYSLILQLGRKYNTPIFEPHVTLIGEVQGDEETLILKTIKLASLIKSYKIELNTVEFLDDYFRCLFLRVRETDEVMKANKEARKIFRREIESRYIPHLSLIYGHLSHQIKEDLITEIDKEIPTRFEVNSIHLFSINGEVKDWYRVKEFPLNFSELSI